MGSTRLPGKVLGDISGKPMLSWVVGRLSRAMTLDDIVVATTQRSDDNAIERLCNANGWNCFRGSYNDVLDRYYWAALENHAQVIVRITSDCPLIEPGIVDLVVQAFHTGQRNIDYASNVVPLRTFPRGLDTEVLHFESLKRAWLEDRNPTWREHVTPYIYRHPELFRIHCVENDIDYSHMRWTVDTPEDMCFVRRICDHFVDDGFSWREVLDLLARCPSWLEINRNVEQKTIQ